MANPVVLQSGLAGAIGSDFRRNLNQLLFVEFGGKVSRLNLFRSGVVISSGSTVLKGTFTFDLDTGVQGGVGPGFDIWWEQVDAVKRMMVPQNAARIVNLGVTNYAAITADVLQTLTYTSTPIDGSNNAGNKLVAGDVFAVLTNKGNYAKVEVVTYGYDLKINWTTYQLDPAYLVLGTGYTQPEDVKASVDGVHAYVTERSGDLVRVTLANANRAAATVVSAGMTAPHQIFLDEAHNAAYLVEFANPGRLLRINLTNGTQTAVLSGLQNAIGLLLSPDLQFAYISEQTPGPDKGRVSRFRLSDGSRTPLVTGMAAPFMLSWADPASSSILVPDRDPANAVRLIDLAHGTSQVVATAVPARPSSVALVNAGDILICSDSAISRLALGAILQPAGPLLMGIGFIPFDKVTVSGKADTTVDPAYFYQVKDTPFGGTLPLMVNHQRAANDGAVYYRVKVDGAVRMDAWSDYKWNGTQYVIQTTGPQNVAGQPGYFPVHPVSELFLWMNPALGMLMDSRNLTNALHTISVEFSNGAGVLIETSTPLTILVDNNQCIGTLLAPKIGLTGADACGVLHHGGALAAQVNMAFTASHPNGFATFSFSLIKGVNPVTLPAVPPTSGPVASAVSPFHDSVSNLLGACPVAGFAEYLYVAATANNGWSRQSQYNASAAVAFVLAV